MDKMSGEEALPPAGGVTGLVPKPAIAPAGNPITDKLTGELKLSREVTITVVVPEEPCTIDRVAGETEMEKSAAAGLNCVAYRTAGSKPNIMNNPATTTLKRRRPSTGLKNLKFDLRGMSLCISSFLLPNEWGALSLWGLRLWP